MRQCGLALSVSAKLYGIKLCIRKALEGLELVDAYVTHVWLLHVSSREKWDGGEEGRGEREGQKREGKVNHVRVSQRTTQARMKQWKQKERETREGF